MIDYQKSKVYRWESSFNVGGWVPYDMAQSVINYIWADYGLSYPPKVQTLSRNANVEGKANRTVVYLQPNNTMLTILHELAHSMTSDLYGESDLHGPRFVGVYMKLLHKYLNIDLFEMLKQAAIHKIDVDYTANPVFVDIKI